MSVSRRSRPAPRSYRNISVKAGILSGATYPARQYTDARTGAKINDARAGMPTAAIAAALEYGTSTIPARPFMADTSATQGKDWARSLNVLLHSPIPVEQAFRTVGQLMKDDIVATIAAWPADNSPAWAAIKGFNHGLIQTGHLQNSVDFAITGGQD
jgi:hypothetical protein